jgi:hypothetical protein
MIYDLMVIAVVEQFFLHEQQFLTRNVAISRLITRIEESLANTTRIR